MLFCWSQLKINKYWWCLLVLDLKTLMTFANNFLCVSCPSANEFSAIFFLLVALSSSNSPWSFQRFRRTLDEISTGFDNRWRISPKTHIVKIYRFRQRYNVAEIGQFLQWGVWGNSLPVVGFEWNCAPYNIAENSVALGHETHNSNI